MLVSEIFTEIRTTELDTNSTKVPDSVLLSGLNIDYGELVMAALRARGDYNFTINETTTDLKSSVGLTPGTNGYNGEYAWPTDLLKPTRVEVSFDGSNYYPCTVYDITDLKSKSEFSASDINATFNQTDPYVRFERNSFFIRPLKTTDGDVTAGIHIWYEQRQAPIVLTNETPSIEPNFHRLFVLMGTLRIMRKYRKEYSQNDRNEIKSEIKELKTDMKQFYSKQIEDGIYFGAKHINYK